MLAVAATGETRIEDKDAIFRMIATAAGQQSMQKGAELAMPPRLSVLADPDLSRKYGTDQHLWISQLQVQQVRLHLSYMLMVWYSVLYVVV